MSLTERKYLDSIEILITAKAINVKWIEEVLKNGVVISSNPHRGAYPLNEDGEPDESVQALIGSTLRDILGEAGEQAQRNIDSLTYTIADRNTIIQTLHDTINQLQHQLAVANNRIAEEIGTVQNLATQLGQANSNISECERQMSQLSQMNDSVHLQLNQVTEDWEKAQDEIVTLKAELESLPKLEEKDAGAN